MRRAAARENVKSLLTFSKSVKSAYDGSMRGSWPAKWAT